MEIKFITSPSRAVAKYYEECVCQSVCLSVCMTYDYDISGTTRTKAQSSPFFVRVAYVRGLDRMSNSMQSSCDIDACENFQAGVDLSAWLVTCEFIFHISVKSE